jgi:type IV secretion system protein VirB6
MTCPTPPTGAGFLATTLEHLDCQAITIGDAGYQALSNSESPLSLVLTAMLSIFVAIVGIRFLVGRAFALSDLIFAALKVGVVLALVSSWPAYRTVVYDVILKAPVEVSTLIGRASSLPGSDGGLVNRLQAVDTGIMTLVAFGSGRTDNNAQKNEDEIAPPLSDFTALGWGKTLFVSMIIGSFGLLRLAGGLFLALAPLFAGFLLFETTRFLFFGWLRTLIAVALGSIGLVIVLGVELAILEPWLSQVLTQRASNIATLSAPFELLSISIAFSVIIFGVFLFAIRLSFTSDVITKVQNLVETITHYLSPAISSSKEKMSFETEKLAEPSRAQTVAQSMQQTLYREGQGADGHASNAMTILQNRDPVMLNAPPKQDSDLNTPLGQTYKSLSRRINNAGLRRNPLS